MVTELNGQIIAWSSCTYILIFILTAFNNKRRLAYEHDAHQPNQKRELKDLSSKIEDLNFRKLRLMKDRALTWQDIQV